MDKNIARQILAKIQAEPDRVNFYDACVFLYENGYNDADMVRLLISIGTFGDTEALVEILKTELEDEDFE